MPLFINGKFVESKTDRWLNNYNPATNELISRVPCATQEEMDSAIQTAQDAFPSWKEKSILGRQQIMFQFRNLIKEHWVRQLHFLWGLTSCAELVSLPVNCMNVTSVWDRPQWSAKMLALDQATFFY